MGASMYAAVSGIIANQVKLNVISNNLANLNTVAFKGSVTNFRTLFAKTLSTGTRPTQDLGGINPKQVGNGVAVSEILTNFAQGGNQFTGRQGDFLIDGEGFFTLLRTDINPLTGNGATDTDAFYLTRAGNFNQDGDGTLVSFNGNKVLGTDTVNGNDPSTVDPVRIPFQLRITKLRDANAVVFDSGISPVGQANALVPAANAGAGETRVEEDVQLINYSMGPDGGITATYSNGDRLSVRTRPNSTNKRELVLFTVDGQDASQNGNTGATDPTMTESLKVAIDPSTGNPTVMPQELQLRLILVTNSPGLIAEGNNNFSLGANVGDTAFGIASTGGRGRIGAGALESSNVDVSTEFTNMILAQRGVEAAGKTISVQNEVLRTIIQLI